MNPKDHLILALDVADTKQALSVVEQLGDAVMFYKIGHQLAFAGGIGFANELLQEGKKVFLDMKLLDIDNTVAKGVENIVRMGITMTTIHAYPKAMKAAVEAARGSDLCLLGVTVLTSMDDADLINAGYEKSAKNLVLERTKMASELGMGGVVASAQEAEGIRKTAKVGMSIVTPGIRPAGSRADDQKRVTTPAKAIAAGATHLVVGRSITAAPDRVSAAKAILNEIASSAL